MSITWIVVANSSTAHVYQHDGPRKGLNKIREMQHPECREKAAALLADRPGRGHSSGTRRTAYEAAHDVRDVEADRFATEIAEQLDRGRRESGFERLILVAAPPFMGRLKRRIGARLKGLVTDCIEKDYTKSDERLIRRQLSSCLYV
jgi:protein required for attachment to host cells